jgi:hypothetical protein
MDQQPTLAYLPKKDSLCSAKKSIDLPEYFGKLTLDFHYRGLGGIL